MAGQFSGNDDTGNGRGTGRITGKESGDQELQELQESGVRRREAGVIGPLVENVQVGMFLVRSANRATQFDRRPQNRCPILQLLNSCNS
jgi:hypothetical protein